MRIVVIGAGVVGLASAYELLQDGHDVVVIDRAVAGQAASHGNAAKIANAETGPVPAPGMVIQGLKWMLKADSPLYVKPSLSPSFVRFMLQMARGCNETAFRAGLATNLRLAQRANELLDEWTEAGLQFEMHRRGTLLAWHDEAHFRARLAQQDLFDEYGVHAEVLDDAALHEFEPALSDSVSHGLYYAGDRQIEPDSLTGALSKRTTELGGRVLEHTEVTGFELNGRRVRAVRTADGARHEVERVVLAAGVWSATLAAQLGLTIPLRPGKGYSVDYTPAPVPLRTSLTLEDAHVAITPLDGMIRVAGTMEFSGFEDSIRTSRVTAIQRAAATGLRGWDADAPHRTPWVGLRPMTPDGLPVIGALADDSNVVVATGHAMLGLTQAPTTARLVRELVAGTATPDPRLSPHRYAPRRERQRQRQAVGA